MTRTCAAANYSSSRQTSAAPVWIAERPRKPPTKRMLYRTLMCRNAGGVCPYAEKCQYAHNRDELRTHVFGANYKTVPCNDFYQLGVCSYGPRCKFQHSRPLGELPTPFVRAPAVLIGVDDFAGALDAASEGEQIRALPRWLFH